MTSRCSEGVAVRFIGRQSIAPTPANARAPPDGVLRTASASPSPPLPSAPAEGARRYGKSQAMPTRSTVRNPSAVVVERFRPRTTARSRGLAARNGRSRGQNCPALDGRSTGNASQLWRRVATAESEPRPERRRPPSTECGSRVLLLACDYGVLIAAETERQRKCAILRANKAPLPMRDVP